jgi:DNA recombination protein RmuC
MIADWMALLDLNSLLLGVFTGLLLALLFSVFAARRGAGRERLRMQPEIEKLEGELHQRDQELAATSRDLAILETRLEEQQKHHAAEKTSLEDAEKRLTESFDRLAGKVFDERSKQFSDLSEKQLGGILKPLVKDLDKFRNTVDESNKEDIRQHAQLQERLKQLENLNQQLNEEAQNLTRALTRDVKAQGNWGEQQLERLMDMTGLKKGENYLTQVSVKGRDGERIQPDLVLLLPEGRTIIIDSKVSLTAWTRYQSAADDAERETLLAEHVLSLRRHIDDLSNKNYPDAEELNALDFVLMFVPIESALIAALQTDPTLPEHALKNRIALLSPANFLATVRTVASIWQIHKQNTNARDIAQRAGFLYDKFVGFTENLRLVGARLEQARKAYDDAYSQLSSGSGNLVGQTEKLRALGAKHAKQLEAGLVEKALEGDDSDDAHLRLVKPEDD